MVKDLHEISVYSRLFVVKNVTVLTFCTSLVNTEPYSLNNVGTGYSVYPFINLGIVIKTDRKSRMTTHQYCFIWLW